MTKSEIIEELKQCKGNRAALEFAVKFIDGCITCSNCKHSNGERTDYPYCDYCDLNYSQWEWEVAE